MAITKEKKQTILADFSHIIAGAESLVFVQFDKLTVAETIQFRRALRAAGVGYKVGKKTLLKRMLAERGYTGALPELPGEIAVAYGTDAIAPAREVYEFQKKHKEQITLVGGVFEGGYKNKEEMMAIATIPSMHTLRGMFANIINSPIQRFVIALDQIAAKKA